MANLYAVLDVPEDVEATWKVINKSELSAADKLKILTALFTKRVGQLKLEDQPAALMFVACRELMDLKTFAGVNSKVNNLANEELNAQVTKLLDLLTIEIDYCDKYIKFNASKTELSLSTQSNRARLSRVQLMAVKVFEYADQWAATGSALHNRVLNLLEMISTSLARFEKAQEDFVKSLKANKSVTQKQKKALAKKAAPAAKKEGCKCPPKENRLAPYPPDLFQGQSTPIKPD